MRACIIGCFVSCTVVTLIFFGLLWHDLDAIALDVPGLPFNGCNAPPSKRMWKLFVPNLVIHTILFLATTIPALRWRGMGKQSQLMDRLARE